MAEAEAWVMIPMLDKDKTRCVLVMRPLVLCKDCTYRGEINCPQYYRRKELSDNYFCADGERR